MFHEECLGKINAKNVELFWNGLVHEFYRLKALITLNTSVVEKKNLYEQHFDREANWSGLLDFHCIQMGLACENIRFSLRNVPSGKERVETDVFAG